MIWLRYVPSTGKFYRAKELEGLGKNQYGIGEEAGYVDADGYTRIRVAGLRFFAHDLAALYMTGKWPKDMLDHEDGNRSNNAWENLRGCSEAQNALNKKIYKNNKSGIVGVRFTGAMKKPWLAEVYMEKGVQTTKSFSTLLDAAAWRKSMEMTRGYHINHGIRR